MSMFPLLLVRISNTCRYLGVVLLSGKRDPMSWSRIRWWSNALRKMQSMNKQECFFYSTTSDSMQDSFSGSSLVNTQSTEEVMKVPDLIKVKTMAFNIAEGGRYIVDILKKSNASVVTIFVRSSVLAKELVTELNENDLNAVEMIGSYQGICDKNGNRVLVVSDKVESDVSLPRADMVKGVIQNDDKFSAKSKSISSVQTPLSGVDVMKNRLHVSNFSSPLATVLLLYNSNDLHFVAQLGQFASLTTIDPPSFHKLEDEEDSWLTNESKVNLPAVHDNFERRPAVSRKVKTSLFKPVYPEERRNKRVGFVDRVRLYVIGGSGGNGSPRTGARGGDGGDVILECQARAMLRHFRFKENRRPKAAHGQHCCIRAKRVNGQRGNDLIVPVPVGSVIKDEAIGHVIADMDKVGQRLKVARGGRGGSPSTTAAAGEKGERKMIILEYKMQTDVGLVGFPNAGKSTLLGALSNAKPKVAEYAFTSLEPTLGRVEYPDFSQLTVADLPGLVEGAHRNKGLGLKFLRHVERAKVLLFVVDVSGFQLSSKHPKRTAFETICLLAKELLSYRQSLINKPKMLVINKMDCADAERKYYRIVNEIGDAISKDKVLHMGDESEDGDKPVAEFNLEYFNMLEELRFEYVLPVSALKQTGIEEIVCKVRELLVGNEEINHS